MVDYIPLTRAAGALETTAELRALAVDRMRGLGYPYVEQELAPPGKGLRFDVTGLTRYTRQVRIYEIKASRADFLRDDKWERYLPFCTHFSFVVPSGLIARWELDPQIGIIEYGAPAFAKMRAARRYGLTIVREDCLRAVRPSRRLRERVGDDEWIALLEALSFGRRGELASVEYEDGAGI
jgi:hypothetical protein